MATGAKSAVKLVPLSDDEYDAIRITGGPGRQAKPSQYLAEVTEALKLMPKDGWKKDSDGHDSAGWYVLKATAANKIEVISRELRKAAKQINADRNDADKIKVAARPRTDHPKLGDFVAWRVEPAPVETPVTEADTASA